ncbi:MAG: transglycosylase SLT domain-containing protein [Pseudorhizobium sp.]
MKKPVLLTAIGLGLSIGWTIAAPLSPPLAERSDPLPYASPDSPPAKAFPMPLTTGAIPRTGRLTPTPMLKAGLDALSNRDARGAILIRNGLPQGSIARHILTWSIATSGLAGVHSQEIAAAEAELAGWPGLDGLRAQSERALFRENADAQTVIAAFEHAPPETAEGTFALARALGADGRQDDATQMIRQLWSSDALDTALEARILKEFGSVLNTADHKARMDYLMYRSRVAQAQRFADLGKAQSLYRAWSAVIREANNADALVKAVDASWADDPAYFFIQIEQLRRKDRYEDAAALLEKAPKDAARLINTSEWWNEQRIVARGLADRGDFRAAYDIVTAHQAVRPTDIVDAEFHAGWYALRHLNDPSAAERHFRRIAEVSNGPISSSRAMYWLARTAEQIGRGDAEEFYRKAAAYPGTFYGQLAAARTGNGALNVADPVPNESDRQAFWNREPVQAISLLESAGQARRAETLIRALAKEIVSPGELALLAAKAQERADHSLALQIGKTAFAEGRDVAALAFPTGVIPATADIAGSGKALAYSVARQESAFNAAAVSPANARGLLQLLPGTAEAVAKRHGLAYAPARLTGDPGYNATLGAHYLGEQIASFGGSYVLTFIAYNAGPRRVQEWINRYGDPRGKSIEEVVDWIERIPYPETRSYVQRIMENYQVYKTRLGQDADIVADLRYGRR